MKYSLFLIIFILFSCSNSGVNKKEEEKEAFQQKNSSSVKESKPIDVNDNPIDSNKVFDNGVIISWTKRGNGESIKDEDVVLIDFKVSLKDGKVVD